MRVYLPVTSRILRRLADTGVLTPAPMTGFAVTPGLREYYLDDDIEELEYAASAAAARASLRLIDADPTSARRRIVIAADAAESMVEIHDDLDRGVIRVTSEVPIAWCASIHADEQAAEEAVSAAALVIDAADLGDPSAEDRVDDTEGFELLWFATQEIEDVLADMHG